MPFLAVEGLDRDGMGGECGGYGTCSGIDDRSGRGHGRYPDYTNHDLVAEYPKLKQAFLIDRRLICLDAVMPPIGDSGGTGTWGRLPSHHCSRAATSSIGTRAWPTWPGTTPAGEPRLCGWPDDIFGDDPETLARDIAIAVGKKEWN